MTHASRSVLIVVDPQQDFFPGGALAVPDADRIIEPLNRLLTAAESVVVTQDWHPPGHVSFASSHIGRQVGERVLLPHGEQRLWPVHCVAETAGAAFHPRLAMPATATVVRKGTHPDIDSYSGFFEEDGQTPAGLHETLCDLGARELTVAGLATDFCVLATVLDACRLGYEVTVIEEACAGIDLNGSLARAWQQMAAAGARRA